MYKEYAELIKRVSEIVGAERAEKCGYDLMMGLDKGDVSDRKKAWERYLEEVKNNESNTDELRDDVWVPEIPL